MAPKADEHPLMSNRTLRAMYRSLAQTRTPKRHDAACWVAPLTGLLSMDAVFNCRPGSVAEVLRPKIPPTIAHPLHRLYAAIGAALTSTGKPPQPAILAFFERRELTGKGWPEALAIAAPLPLLLIVLPSRKGREDTLDLAKLARVASLPSIPVDSQDPIALYRVAQESLGRARSGGGAALLEAIRLDDAPPAIEKLADYLIQRGVASQSWLDRTRSNFPNAPANASEVGRTIEGTLATSSSLPFEVRVRNGLLLSLASLTLCGLPSALAQSTETASTAPASAPLTLALAANEDWAQAQTPAPAKAEPPRDILPTKPNYTAYAPYGIPDEDKPKKDHEGSAYIPLDSWIYPQLDRLYSMGYLNTMFLGLRPYTRRSVLHMLQGSEDEILQGRNDQAQAMLAKLLTELDSEKPDGKAPRGLVYGVHQIYDRGMYISQQTLRDSYHLGNTIVNDYGRPYQPGFNNLLGASYLAEKGRFSFYVRAEYQHAPGARGYTDTLADTLSGIDEVTPTGFGRDQDTIPRGPIAEQNPFRIVEGSVSFHLFGHEFSGGKNDAWLGPARGGALAWSNNAENIYSFRINRIEPMTIPLVSRILGPLRYDFFYGSLKGHTSPNHPYVHAEAFSFKPTANFEFGFERTVIFGGAAHSPVTVAKFFRSFFDLNDVSGVQKYSRDDPGARFSAFNASYRLPFLRRSTTFYVDSIAHDDVSPISAPRRAAFRTGLYLAQIPHFAKLDLRVEAVLTDPKVDRSVRGVFNYFETIQKQGYTNKGYILGDWIGREAKGGQAWLTYHASPTEWYQLEYLNKKNAKDFIPLGTTQHSLKFTVVKRFLKNYELNYWVQYERWKAPIYLSGQRSDTTLAVQLSYFPLLHSRSN